MKNQEERTREQMMLFRVVNGGQAIEPGVMSIDLVKSKTRVRFVKVDTDGIEWKRPEANGSRFTSSIELKVAPRNENLDTFRVRVDYVGGPPVIGGIRGGDKKDGTLAAGEAENPATRIERRFEKLKTDKSMSDANKKYYQWFTLLDKHSDEEVIAATPSNGGRDVAALITNLRQDLLANLSARATGARTGDDALVCTPEFTSDVAVNTLHIFERVFMKGAAEAAAMKLNGGVGGKEDLAREITNAFLAFCQGDLRIVAELSDLNVEPDSAMVFLFAEYALTLLQVVEQFGPEESENLENPRAKEIARQIFIDPELLDLWKRVAASFVLGQRVYMRAYAPHRLHGPAHFADYVRTNFDPTEKLDDDELDKLKERYGKLKLSHKEEPQLAKAALRSVYWRHAMNAVEAFPGSLEDERSDELDNLMLPTADKPDQSATVSLRAVRGADPSIRRHVRHEVASVATVPTGIASTDKLGKLGIKGPRLECLATMLAAYASALSRKIDPKEVGITESSTVDKIALRLNELIARGAALGKPAS